ncbi:MAG: hypothetical protein LLF89_08880, partial [Spirochaetaceae bacterium]|nr:hypothetical protein [Spirochaetaceae bacterium]
LFRRKEYGEALFSEAGVFSGLLYFWAAGIGARFALGMHLAWFDAIGLGLPLLALLFSRPLEALTDSIASAGHSGQHRHGEHEAGGERLWASLTESLAELFRTVSEHLANTLTFLMVGAYALSHALLGTAFFKTAEIVRLRVPGGVFWQILVYVIGNFIIMTLEGTIVVVQCIRLQDNEFFSKFFNRTGKPFSPLCFEGQAFIRQFDKPGKGAMK